MCGISSSFSNHPDKQRDKQIQIYTRGENIITSLSWVMNIMNMDKLESNWTHAPKDFKNVCSMCSSSKFNRHIHVVDSPDWQGHGSCHLQHCRPPTAQIREWTTWGWSVINMVGNGNGLMACRLFDSKSFSKTIPRDPRKTTTLTFATCSAIKYEALQQCCRLTCNIWKSPFVLFVYPMRYTWLDNNVYRHTLLCVHAR